MSKIENILNYLGEPYKIDSIDKEPVIFRSLPGYEFEVSGLNDNSKKFVLYVWAITGVREVIAIYEGTADKENLKDILGYYAAKYQNLTSQIRVEREDQTK